MATDNSTSTLPLFIKKPNGRYAEASKNDIREVAANYVDTPKGQVIKNSGDVSKYLITKFSHLEHEVFSVILLDNRYRIIDCVEMFRGTINGTSVHAREVVKLSLARNAAALILVHNHPSGNNRPSKADEQITQRLRDALLLVDIIVLDHLIVAGNSTVSFASRGLLQVKS